MEIAYLDVMNDRNLLIRNAVAEDARILANWWNDGKIMEHAGFPKGLGTAAEKVAADIASDSDDTRRRLILCCNGVPIGEMCYRILEDRSVDIGIKICEAEHQEKGIGRIALSMLVKELFCCGYPKIVLDTDLKNTRAQHVYEKLGFRKLRINYDSWQNQLGQWESSVDYELTADTFRDFAV